MKESKDIENMILKHLSFLWSLSKTKKTLIVKNKGYKRSLSLIKIFINIVNGARKSSVGVL